MLDFSKLMQAASKGNSQQAQVNAQFGAQGFSQPPPRNDNYSPTKNYDHELNQVDINN